MKKIKTGGPAFPKNYGVPHEGMSLRDYFAGLAMQGLLAADSNNEWDPDICVILAYRIADAMLAERERGE